jgi:HK97 gp10 family phage protein
VIEIADFSASVDLSEIIPEALQDENLAKEMVKAGQQILQNAIKNNAQKYKKTGSMANSVKAKAPTSSRSGGVIGSVTFTGKDKNGMNNAQKALWLDYGTKHINGTAFVRSAVKSSEGAISEVLEQVFNSKAKG